MKVIINEQHSLLPEQEDILNSRFKRWKFLKVPATGWTLEEMKKIVLDLIVGREKVTFVSPVPAMLVMLRGRCGASVFHNDHREKKELPNGRVISVTAKTGWQIVSATDLYR